MHEGADRQARRFALRLHVIQEGRVLIQGVGAEGFAAELGTAIETGRQGKRRSILPNRLKQVELQLRGNDGMQARIGVDPEHALQYVAAVVGDGRARLVQRITDYLPVIAWLPRAGAVARPVRTQDQVLVLGVVALHAPFGVIAGDGLKERRSDEVRRVAVVQGAGLHRFAPGSAVKVGDE